LAVSAAFDSATGANGKLHGIRQPINIIVGVTGKDVESVCRGGN
jgi:hypothetical protein